jgi:hypothetical protein
MAYKFYRGDGRKPEDIKGAGGFSNWKAPLTVQQARNLMLRSSDASLFTNLPEKSDWNSFFRPGKTYGLGSYAQNIKYATAKSHTSSYVSTDPSEDCGGYENEGFVYEIEFDTLYLGKSITGPFAAPSGSNPFKVLVSPKLVLDTMDLSTSTVVALCCIGEVAFFSPIPYANVKRYRQSGTSGWQSMPA